MKKCLLSLLFIAIYPFSYSQDKQLTLEDAFLRARTSMAPENLAQLQFFENSNDYVFLKKLNNTDTWMRGNYKLAGKEWPFLTLEILNRYMQEAGGEPFTAMPAIRFTAGGWTMSQKGNKISYNPALKKIKVLQPGELSGKENADLSIAGYTAYLQDFNLYVQKENEISQVTTDGSKNIVYASSVHRDEFGITKGTFWSTKGTKLAYYRMDQEMVADYPIINWTKRPAVAELIKYPMAGDKSHEVRVGVFNTETKTTIWLKTGLPAEQYLTNIAWSPDDKYVFIAVLNREQNHLKLNQYNAATGDFIKTLFEETDTKYTEPLVPMLFEPSNASRFIWQSNRDGWNHLYLYDISGKLIKQLTKGNWEVIDVRGFDQKGEQLYFTSTIVSPVDRSFCSVSLKSGQTAVLSSGTGVHSCLLSADGSTLLDGFSTANTPRKIIITNLKKRKNNPPVILLNAANPLVNYSTADPDLFTIKNKAGDSLYCRLFKPADMNTAAKYPVIVYWYGGPHAQMILNSWNGGAGDYWFRYMAQRGYVVFTMDTRGSDNRGRAFEQSIFRRLGDAQMEDLDAGIQWLSGQSYTDMNRMGLFGWSFGGFMTIDYVLNHPGVFRAAVAGGPVTDWSLYEVMYGERYMDTPQENPEGYAATNLVKQAGKLRDKLLLIHGLQDPVVVQQHSVNYVKASVDQGIQVDYMIYPGHEHNVTGKDRVHLYRKVTDYLIENLK